MLTSTTIPRIHPLSTEPRRTVSSKNLHSSENSLMILSADGLVSISNRMFEVDNQYCRKKVTLRYTADLSDVYIVENEGNTLTPVKLLNKHENSRVKRKVYISSPAAESPVSGQAAAGQSASGTTSSTANNNIG